MGNNICLGKKALVEICLVPESLKIDNEKLMKEIQESLQCDWLLKVENITVKTEQ